MQTGETYRLTGRWQTGNAIKPPEGDRLVRTLDRVISKSGVGSRTEARAWIREGKAAVNGVVVRDPDQWLDVARDRVTLDGRPLARPKPVYLVLYKPRGYLTTYDDPEGRPTVFDLLPAEESYLFPVGRLDLDTSGLLLLTNDSTFAERITNPDFKVPKTYQVKASVHLEDAQLDELRSGLELKDGPTRPAIVTRIREAGGKTVFEITITEGRNLQVRRMVEALGGIVLKLVRIAIGPLRIGAQPIGTVRPLTADELRAFGFGSPKKTSATRAAKPRWRKR
jgi:23S rRNA pseudouridine2605 synthase